LQAVLYEEDDNFFTPMQIEHDCNEADNIFLFSLRQSKPIIADPIDFEDFLAKNKTLIQNDPQREMLLFPSDDIIVSLARSYIVENINHNCCTFLGKLYIVARNQNCIQKSRE
jgi:Domain of unknown function (DUF3398)